MKYLIINNNDGFPIEDKNLIIYVNQLNTEIYKKYFNIKPLGDTCSELEIVLENKEYIKIQHLLQFSPLSTQKKQLSLVIYENNEITLIKYYGSYIRSININDDFVNLNILSDFHELHNDGLDDLKLLFKSFERDKILNQLGI